MKYGSPIGCVEPGVEGRQYGHTDSGIINVAGCLFAAVTNGRKATGVDGSYCGEVVTYESGAPDSFQTFEEFFEGVKGQIKYAIEEAHANLVICEKLLAEQFNLPTFTILLDGALEKAMDATAGGAKVNIGPTMQMVGFGTMADSVAAVKKVVFDDKEATLQEVADACMNNFMNLVRTMLNDYGVYHVQFNTLSKEALIDAKAHPENYPTLIVRVAGYSVYWTDLAERVQDDIINRTEHTF